MPITRTPLNHFEMLACHDVASGQATIVCSAFGEWTLPGGKVVFSRREAIIKAQKLHKIMTEKK